MVTLDEEWCLCAPERSPPEIPELPFKIPGIWAKDNPPGLSQNVSPVVVKQKPGSTPISQKQYFIPHKAQVNIQTHFVRLLIYGIL
jgi:hypothetical protein